MTQRFRIAARQFLAAPSAFGGLQRLYVVALLRGNHRALMFRMARLAGPSLLRLLLLPPRLGVRMLRARSERGILRRVSFDPPSQFLKLRFHLRDSCQQRANDRPGFRRLTTNYVFRDDGFHAHCCGMKPTYESRPVFRKKTSPARERLRSGPIAFRATDSTCVWDGAYVCAVAPKALPQRPRKLPPVSWATRIRKADNWGLK